MGEDFELLEGAQPEKQKQAYIPVEEFEEALQHASGFSSFCERMSIPL